MFLDDKIFINVFKLTDSPELSPIQNNFWKMKTTKMMRIDGIILKELEKNSFLVGAK